MGDVSFPDCRRCGDPGYACACGDVAADDANPFVRRWPRTGYRLTPAQQAERRWQAHDQAVAAARARPRPAVPPVIQCEEVRSRKTGKVVQWRWHCSYCKCWHHHSASPGLRMSHCVEPRSPYFEIEYVLELAGDGKVQRRI
jgi:hypothetical protein